MSYYIYVYSPSDFTTPPPAEVGASAAGSGPFTLTLKPGASGTRIEVSDDDSIFDEIDGSQVLTSDVDLDGTVFTGGTTVHTAYDLLNSASGHQVTSIHFSGDRYQEGAVHGIVSTDALEPGQSSSFDQERTSHHQANEYGQYAACFCAGAMIGTVGGPVAVEHLCGAKVALIEPAAQVTYYHLLFDHHRVIFANGAATESFLPETAALHGLGRAAMQELEALFPDLGRGAVLQPLPAARMCLKAHEAAVLAM